MNELTNQHVLDWLEALSACYTDNKAMLSDLDRAIGDGDHGNNMSRGFKAVAEKIQDWADKDIGTLFKTTAMTLISKVGGASGPLYGSFFLKASMKANGKSVLTVSELGAVFQEGLAAVVQRGKAEPGDKTMVDALKPAVEALLEAKGKPLEEALAMAEKAAREGAESTIPLAAKKGRASYLGERSTNHKDPGAESTALLFEVLHQVISDS